MLKPFKMATEALSTDRYPTASAVLPLKFVLLSQLQPSPGGPAALNEMKSKMSTDLKKRYGDDKDAFMLLNTASYLDPRFHRLIHLGRDQRQEVRERVKRELMLIAAEKGEGVEEEAAMVVTERQHQEKSAIGVMGNLFGDVYREGAAADGVADDVRAVEAVLQQEIMMYESETPLPTDSNPLLWWKMSRSIYPHLAQLARRYLSIPGTSVRAERVFSTAGIIVNKKRAALDPENVDRLVFLANNL